ncbi:MAG: phasin family protein [Clostridiales bacterium]|jgi:polyhydroxyalkanoate synthesis regulator phasin|nr:phasin family protein [Eubacteriales bacterium]MDH7567146.1 phasin family protein [Clostridiales bacterium]
MEINLKNVLLAGIGTIAYTYEKGISMVEDLVKKGELTFNQGKELNEELKRKFDPENKRNQAGSTLSEERLKEILAGLNLATKQDIAELSERISKLENK